MKNPVPPAPNSCYVLDMERLLFVPSADELFLCQGGGEGSAEGAGGGALAALRRRGWPTTARVLGGPAGGALEHGHLLELIDALPVLAAHPAGDGAGPGAAAPRTLGAWAEAARLALSLVAEGRLRPQLRPRHVHAGDPRLAGWSARWVAAPDPSEAARAARIGARLAPLEIALPLGRLTAAQLAPHVYHDGARLVRRFLDGAADLLVREAGWRGALVRLRGLPPEAWEGRLVRALCELHGGLALGPDEPQELGEELNAWAREEVEGPMGPLLFPSPPSWRAAEPLQDALLRMTAPAARLARHLLKGLDAPRTLAALHHLDPIAV